MLNLNWSSYECKYRYQASGNLSHRHHCAWILYQVGFIGLVAPHIVRQAIGSNHTFLIPGSMLTGAALLLLGDLVARTAASPIQLPIGAITSFLGGPLFLYLLFKGNKREC